MSTLFPILYCQGKGGEVRFWKVWATENKVFKAYGVKGGKEIVNSRSVKGKNQGKKNETTDQQQAVLEGERAWVKKLDKEYKPADDDEHGLELYNRVMKSKASAGGVNRNAFTEKEDEENEIPDDSHPVEYQRVLPMLATKFSEEDENWKKYFDFH